MNDTVTVRRLGPREATEAVEALAEVLLDCVEGGASVSFMWPLPRERAGWQRAGVVPKYALMPGGEFCATSFFYKHLQAR